MHHENKSRIICLTKDIISQINSYLWKGHNKSHQWNHDTTSWHCQIPQEYHNLKHGTDVRLSSFTPITFPNKFAWTIMLIQLCFHFFKMMNITTTTGPFVVVVVFFFSVFFFLYFISFHYILHSTNKVKKKLEKA